MYQLVICLLLAIASSFACAASADLKDRLSSAGISASFPGDNSYASASTAYNLRLQVRPAAVVYPKTPQEVSQVIKIGVSQNLKVVARSGGHSYIANGLGGRDGSIVVDMKNFNEITVSKGTAVIESGNRLGDVATALANNGRAIPHGTCPYVGIGGHAGYGGFGFTSRMWGLTLDTVTAVNLVMANGTIAHVTNQNQPELFWGLRGAAPSFGIVTSYEVKTFPVPPSSTIYQYTWNLNATAAARGLSSLQNFVKTNIPSQLGASITLGKGWSPGTVYFSLSGGWYGQPQELDSVLSPFLRQMPPNPTKNIKGGSYIDSVTFLAGGSLNTKSKPDSHDTFYAKSLTTPASSPLSDAAIQAFTRYLTAQGDSTNLEWFIEIDLYGGTNSAINTIEADASAFAQRSSTFTFQLYASSPGKRPPFPQNGFAFVDGAVNAITSNSVNNWPYGAYTNYVDDKLADWQQRYYGGHYTRLQALKAKYDPQDIFDFPTGITK